jgi:flagellar hook-length control protein FliK
MTTDRTASARPAALAERPANGPRKQDPAADVFAQILDAKAPADQPKRPDAPRNDAPKPKADGKDGDPKKPAADQPNAATDPAQTVAPDPTAQPVVPAEPVPATANQLAAQLASPLPAPVQPLPETTAPIQAPVGAVPAATVAPAQPAIPAQPVAQPAQAQNAAPAQPAVQAATEQTTAPAVPTADTPATPVKTDDVKLPQAPASPVAHAQPQPAAQPAAQAQANAGDTGQQQPSQSQPEQTAAPAPTPATAHVADAPKAEAPAQPQPAQAPAPAAQPAAPERAVPLYRAPHTAAAVIHLAQQHGVTHARINLKPAELGGIEVRLHSTPQGISAHLIADSPQAAKALQHASDDLRRQLESRDVNLLSLDVSTSNGDDGRQAGFGADAGREGSASTPSRTGYGLTNDQPAEAPAETTLVLPDGVLVDVLA